jgi:hypothetical protein
MPSLQSRNGRPISRASSSYVPYLSSRLREPCSELTLSDASLSRALPLYQTHPTEGLPARVKQPFLRRTMHPLPPAAECSPSSAFIADSGLEIKVCIGSYKLFFVPETEDFFARRLSEGEERERKGQVERKREEGRSALERFAEERLGLGSSGSEGSGKGKEREVAPMEGESVSRAGEAVKGGEEPVAIGAPLAA